jgi:hypothetical protein
MNSAQACPDSVEQFVLGDESLAALDQEAQDVERPPTDGHRMPIQPQFAAIR